MMLMPMLMPMLILMIIIGLAAVHTHTTAVQWQPRPGAEGNPSALVGTADRLGCQGTRALWLASQVALGSWAILLITVPCWESACYLPGQALRYDYSALSSHI